VDRRDEVRVMLASLGKLSATISTNANIHDKATKLQVHKAPVGNTLTGLRKTLGPAQASDGSRYGVVLTLRALRNGWVCATVG
jgi:hypothetical protein